MSILVKMETFVYKNIVVHMQGKQTFKFVDDYYKKGDRVLDFGCGVGSNSTLFHNDDYIGVEVDKSRVLSSRLKYPKSKFETIPLISTPNDKIPFEDNSFDIIFISLCLHHIDSSTCKLLFKEFSRVLKDTGKIIGIEPCILSKKYFSNVIMNIIDAGDYILPIEEYKKIYSSEAFNVKDINIVKTAGYHLWQYSAKPNGNGVSEYTGSMTKYRYLIRPIHLVMLYGKWVALLFIFYLIINQIIN
jgi:ubiquinone/menaquinone biosynthesis C-methylase UbiE